jgi:hypothetical protein
VIFLSLRTEVGLIAVTTSACSLRATEQFDPIFKASYSESVLSNLGRNIKYSDCGLSCYFTSNSRFQPRNCLKLGRYHFHPRRFQYPILHFLLSYFDLCQPTNCRCRGLLLHLIRHATLCRTALEEGSTIRRNLHLTTHMYNIRWYSKPHTQQASGLRPSP